MKKDMDIPPQHQKQQPGREGEMTPQPESKEREYLAAGKLRGCVKRL